MSKQKWLITGGAGYIGTHIADLFITAGKDVVLLDSLYQGLESRVDYLRIPSPSRAAARACAFTMTSFAYF